jgi:FKBP-type peptidyl-prolyl cis-trans isomerase 2
MPGKYTTIGIHLLEGLALMRTVQQGDLVQVRYVKRLQDGRRATSREPLMVTVGIDHPRLPGLGAALIGLTSGQSATVTVPPELAYGLSDPARIRRWPRRRFPIETALQTGKLIRITDVRGRRRRVRILQADSKAVVFDANHPWAGQTLDLEVTLLGFLEPPRGPEVINMAPRKQEPRRSRVVAFDVDAASLASLRDALPERDIVSVQGATVASLSGHWAPRAADILFVGLRDSVAETCERCGGNETISVVPRDNVAETLGLCRLLSSCTSRSPEARKDKIETSVPEQRLQRQAIRNPRVFLLVPAELEALADEAFAAGVHGCLLLPIHANDVTTVLAHGLADNEQGRHKRAIRRQEEDDPRQDYGGEG